MRKIAIVGGTGVENPETLKDKGFERKIVQTPYGPALCTIGEMFGNMVVFLSRHGLDHSVAPHMINYRANIWALKSLGIEEVFGTSATGSLNPDMKPGHFVVCDQLLDFTKNRINTFYDNPIRGVAHADFTNPYCETLRRKVIAVLKKTDIPFHEKGCYVCTDGPRFETAAEVRAYAMLGGDVIGMTNAQEVVLAREAELCYTNVAIVTNMGAGISPTPLSHKEVVDAMADSVKKMETVIHGFLKYNRKVKDVCICKHAMEHFGGFKLDPELDKL